MKTDDVMVSKWQNAQANEEYMNLQISTEHYDLHWEVMLKDYPLCELAKKITPEMAVLDIGCGPVSIMQRLPVKCKEMVAIDPLNDSYAGKFARSPALTFINSAFENCSIQKNHFNAVFCINALDHMLSIDKSLEKISECLEKGGYLFLWYENTSPLTVLLGKMGYKKALEKFHIHILRFQYIDKFLRARGLTRIGQRFRPAMRMQRILSGLKHITGISKLSDADQKVSIMGQKSKGKIFFDVIIISLESILYYIMPARFCYIVESLYEKSRD